MIQSPLFWLGLFVLVPVLWRIAARRRSLAIAVVSGLMLAVEAPFFVLFLVGGLTLALTTFGRWPGGARVGLVVALALALLGAKIGLVWDPDRIGAIVPIGFSFISFRLIHYFVERSRDQLPVHTTIDVLAWILLFPIVSAGPVARFEPFCAPAAPAFDRAQLAEGLQRIIVGLGKRFILADVLQATLMRGEGPEVLLDRLDGLSLFRIWVWVLGSFFRLYFDFSGYSDIAIGAARLLGVRVEENFNWPILARSPVEFWRRWHMSLSGWCQAYLYLPLLGATRSPVIASILTFVVMGLWHAATGPWLLWGLLHGLGVAAVGAARNGLRRRGVRTIRWSVLGIPLTLCFVASTHAFTVVHGVGTTWDALRLWLRLFGVHLDG
jgi:alginate O-acetyltransferase complex protein AlgI